MIQRQPSFDKNLSKIVKNLPKAGKPLGSYRPVVVNHPFVYISGQLPQQDGKITCGIVGETHTIKQAQTAAQTVALMIFSHLIQHFGTLENIVQVIKLEGYVSCTKKFTDHPNVINGASDLMIKVFGDAGFHSRTAVGVTSLPSGALLEISAIFAIK